MWLLIALLGAAVGVVGTLVGAGGGFLVVPILLLLFGADPAQVAGTSLVMVTVNAAAGALAYWRQGRVDWKTGLLLIVASVPGSLLGALAGPYLPARQFRLIFGAVLLGLAAWTAWKAIRPPSELAATGEPRPAARAGRPWVALRSLTVRDGTTYQYTYPVWLAASLAMGIGFAGAVLGIGGGPLLVPALLYGLRLPLAVAPATSQVMIAVSSAGAAAVSVAGGHVDVGQATALSVGALAGAPLGAWISGRIRGLWIVLTLSFLLALLGVRLLA